MYRLVSLTALVMTIAMPAARAADDRLTGYKPVDLSSWAPRTASSAMELVEPLYRTHPRRLEGRPGLQITLRKDADSKLVIDIEMTGFLDDSVGGAQFRAIVVSEPAAAGSWKPSDNATSAIAASTQASRRPSRVLEHQST